MAQFRKMNVINVTSLPVIRVEEKPRTFFTEWNSEEDSGRKDLDNNLPACFIGSMDQVNQRIANVDLSPDLLANILAIEKLEMEKKALKQKSRSITEDRDKSPTNEIRPCGPESKNAKSYLFKRKMADKNLLVELYQYPEFDSSVPNELPNGVDVCDMVDNVVRGERDPFSGKSFCTRKELKKSLSSPYTRAILLDSFWWIFHDRYQPKKELQNKLFDRIARNYARLLLNEPRSHYEEALLKRLPSLLSKCLYTSFCSCFPQSWFNTHEFKTDICNTMNLWIAGVYPCPQSYVYWDYSELDPERFRREELMSQRKRVVKGRELSLLIRKRLSFQKAMYHKRARTTQSHPACRSPEMVENCFNIYGKSPLIVYFLYNYSFLRQHGQDVLVARREKANIVPESVPTYDDIIAQALHNMKKRKEHLFRLSRLHCSEWNSFDKYVKQQQERYSRKMKKIDQAAAEKKQADRTVIPASTFNEQCLEKKSRGSHQRECEFLLRKERGIMEKRPMLFTSSLSFSSPEDPQDFLKGFETAATREAKIVKKSKPVQRKKEVMLFDLSSSSSAEESLAGEPDKVCTC